MMDKPVDIGAMPNAGASADGKVIFFDFYGNDGVTYKFKVTHEAMPTIVDLLIKCATEAERLRGDDFKPGERLKGQTFESNRFTTGVTADGQAVLSFESPGRRSIIMTFSREQCSKMAQALAELSSRLGPPQQGAMSN
jgi:hypothetical protein